MLSQWTGYVFTPISARWLLPSRASHRHAISSREASARAVPGVISDSRSNRLQHAPSQLTE